MARGGWVKLKSLKVVGLVHRNEGFDLLEAGFVKVVNLEGNHKDGCMEWNFTRSGVYLVSGDGKRCLGNMQGPIDDLESNGTCNCMYVDPVLLRPDA